MWTCYYEVLHLAHWVSKIPGLLRRGSESVSYLAPDKNSDNSNLLAHSLSKGGKIATSVQQTLTVVKLTAR